jgi:MOSC domain-containing protein YiiM
MSTQEATLMGIAIAPKIMADMETREAVSVAVETGIDGDARGKKRGRQVTILFEDDWADAVAETGPAMDWTERRANLLVWGMRSPQEEGGVFTIGEVILEVTMETDPCEIMEGKRPGLRQAMTPKWRGGVCCVVKSGGDLRLGDAVTYAPKA